MRVAAVLLQLTEHLSPGGEVNDWTRQPLVPSHAETPFPATPLALFAGV